jgi:glucosamine--fructose-6-phosphate aminotransferase (isomerizing)
VSEDILLGEIQEQADAIRRLVGAHREIESVARTVAKQHPRLIRMVAHGSSDNVAAYGVYAFALLAGVTALRDSISHLTYYDTQISMRDSVVLAISQSGETPDVLDYAKRAREGGALTVAITNESGSSLTNEADEVVLLRAGSERAIAATKTYTSQLAAIALLAGAISQRTATVATALEELAGLTEAETS